MLYKFLSSKYSIFLFLIIVLLLGVYRIVPFFSDPTPLGYDPGLYKMLFNEYAQNLPNIHYDNLSWWVQAAYPPFLGFFSNILYIIGYSDQFLLTYFLGFLSCITAIYLYLGSKIDNRKIVGILSFSIFLISITQYQNFWLNYYKQIIGIIFMLTSFFLLEKNKYILSFPLILSIFTVHRPTGIYFLTTYIFYTILQYILKRENKYKALLLVLLAGITSIFIYGSLFDTLILDLIKPLTTTALWEWRSGTYFLRDDFWFFNLLIIIPSLFWLFLKIKRKEFDIMTCWYIVWVLWVGLRLFFHTRMYIFLDIFTIYLAAYAFAELYAKRRKIFFILFSTFFILQSFFYVWYIHFRGMALISENEFHFIESIPQRIEKDAMMMVSVSYYSPWIAGYVWPNVVAPGLFEFDKWNESQWQTWWQWDGNVKCDMLKSSFSDEEMPDYLYHWVFPKYLDISNGSCFEIVDQWEDMYLISIKH